MIQLPSNQKPFDVFVRADPAIAKLERGELDDKAWDEAKKAYEHKIEVALESGDWTDVLSGHGEPTRFTLRHIPGWLQRRLADRALNGKIGQAEFYLQMVRAALVAISNAGGIEYKSESEADFGPMASMKLMSQLDAIDKDIVNELARFVIHRSTQGVSPKS